MHGRCARGVSRSTAPRFQRRANRTNNRGPPGKLSAHGATLPAGERPGVDYVDAFEASTDRAHALAAGLVPAAIQITRSASSVRLGDDPDVGPG
jgi:hypothetical protein